MCTDAMDALRRVLQGFCPKGVEKEAVGVPQIAETLGLKTESQRQMLRHRLSHLVKRGEVKKLARGLYLHLPGKEPRRDGQSYVKMWRAVRAHRDDTFTILKIVQVSRIDNSTVARYMRALEDGGYVRRAGKDRNTLLFRGTSQLREQRTTFYPPIEITDSYRAERIACAALHRLTLEDMSQPRVRRKIREQLAILQNRFNQDEKSEETHAE